MVWRVAEVGAFPALDQNTLLLLGVSQGVYIGGKLAGTSALARAQAIQLDLDLRTGELCDLKAEIASLQGRKTSGNAAVPPFGAADQERLDAAIAELTAKSAKVAELTAAMTQAGRDAGLSPT